MTAIAGLWRFDKRPDAAEGCARMLVAQELYGPDHGAKWSDENIALGRRLMRILPEDAFDRQPLVGSNGHYVLVADVRLDNRDELTEALRIPATQARTLCDAAILLASIERWDESCPERLIGDYAFVAWDRLRQRLLLARDPLGMRPLHYHRGDDFFAFASMPKGLHAHPDVPYAPDMERIAEFLVMMPETGTQSFFVGVERVQPGHIVTVTANGLTTRRHWQPARRQITLSPEEYTDKLRDLLDQAVSCRLRGTGDVGATLSGGLDSGAVTATAARLLATSGRKIIAFTGAPREGYDGFLPRKGIVDEGPFAAATAALYPNIEHILVRNEGRSPLADLDRRFYLLDRPFRGVCASGWSRSFQNAILKRKLRVVLTGGFGNLGLSYDGLELLPELFSSGHWFRLWREASALVASRQMRWRGAVVETLCPWCPPDLWAWIKKVGGKEVLEIKDFSAIRPDRFDELDLQARARASNHDFSLRGWKNAFTKRLQILQAIDPGNHHKESLGGFQVEYRDPTADVRLLEFCLAVPTEQFLRNGMPRSLARRALADRLPQKIVEQTRTGVQVADWHEDLNAARTDIEDELGRLEDCPAVASTLDLPRLRRLTEAWPSSGWERTDVEMRYRYTLLRAIAVGHFLRRATGSNA